MKEIQWQRLQQKRHPGVELLKLTLPSNMLLCHEHNFKHGLEVWTIRLTCKSENFFPFLWKNTSLGKLLIHKNDYFYSVYIFCDNCQVLIDYMEWGYINAFYYLGV